MKKEMKNCCSSVPKIDCGCGAARIEAPPESAEATKAGKKILNVDLLVIDLETCERCVPTGDQLKTAVRLLTPMAEELGVELSYCETVVQTSEQAKAEALKSSPTIRLNGRDIDQDIRESVCESCGDLTGDGAAVECREWHYRGQVHPSPPLELLIEAITSALLNIDELPPVVPSPLEELPENLQRFFDNRRQCKTESGAGPSCCC